MLKVREDGNGHFYYDQHVVREIKNPSYKQGVDSRSTSPADGSESEDSDSIIGTDQYARKRKSAAAQREFRWITIGVGRVAWSNQVHIGCQVPRLCEPGNLSIVCPK